MLADSFEGWGGGGAFGVEHCDGFSCECFEPNVHFIKICECSCFANLSFILLTGSHQSCVDWGYLFQMFNLKSDQQVQLQCFKVFSIFSSAGM